MPWKHDSCNQPLLTGVLCTSREIWGCGRAVKALPLSQEAWVLILTSFFRVSGLPSLGPILLSVKWGSHLPVVRVGGFSIQRRPEREAQ